MEISSLNAGMIAIIETVGDTRCELYISILAVLPISCSQSISPGDKGPFLPIGSGHTGFKISVAELAVTVFENAWYWFLCVETADEKLRVLEMSAFSSLLLVSSTLVEITPR